MVVYLGVGHSAGYGLMPFFCFPQQQLPTCCLVQAFLAGACIFFYRYVFNKLNRSNDGIFGATHPVFEPGSEWYT